MRIGREVILDVILDCHRAYKAYSFVRYEFPVARSETRVDPRRHRDGLRNADADPGTGHPRAHGGEYRLRWVGPDRNRQDRRLRTGAATASRHHPSHAAGSD